MRHILSFLIFLITSPAMAQLFWSEATQVNPNTNTQQQRPRINLSGETPTVLWTQGSEHIWFSRMGLDGTFAEPIDLNEQNLECYLASYGGVDFAMEGNKAYLVFMTLPFTAAKIYLKTSTDGGLTWSASSQVSLPDSIIPFLPTVSIDSDLQPHIMFMAYDSNYENPQYHVIKSTDDGLSFSNSVNASALAPHEVCDCCPAHLSIDGDDKVALFRNNDQNIRDLWVSTSTDAGNSFPLSKDIDPNDWFINSCPSSGPDAVLENGSLQSVWMSAGSGSTHVYYSKMNIATQEEESILLNETGTNDNYPRIAGNKDTVGIVFQSNVENKPRIGFMYSNDGGITFSNIEIVNHDAESMQQKTDIAFKNGIFHLVYRDLFSGNLWYRKASFNELTGISIFEKTSPLLYPNPSVGQLHFSVDVNRLQLYNTMGELVYHSIVNDSEPIQLTNLPAGVYFARLEVNGKNRTEKIVLKK